MMCVELGDKTRAEFEEVFPKPASSEWRQESNYYCWGTRGSVHPYNELWQAWLAAKAKYEPRWIPVSEFDPNTQNCQILAVAYNMSMSSGFFEDGEFALSDMVEHGALFEGDIDWFKKHWQYWMPIPSVPSTQGEE